MKKVVKKITALLVALALLLTALPMSAMAATTDSMSVGLTVNGSSGDCSWSLDWGTKHMDVYGNGRMGDYPVSKGAPRNVGSMDVYSVTIHSGVTYIGSESFKNMDLNSITIPNTVTGIGNSAFEGTKLTQITIPDSVKTIGEKAFYGCTSLIKVTMPSTMTYIGNSAFYNCVELKRLTVPEGITTLNDQVFKNCGDLDEAILPSTLKSIGANTFDLCYSLKNIDFPSNLKSIGQRAFYQSGLQSVTIPDSVTSIGTEAFLDCEFMTEAHIGNGLSSISLAAFKNCTSLSDVTFSENLKTIGESAFENCAFSSLTFPESLTRINNTAFKNCTSLETVVFPDGLMRIGDNAFAGMPNLTSITIPSALSFMGDNNFKNSVWYNNLPDGPIYLGKVFYDYKGQCPSTLTIEPGTVGIAGGACLGSETLEKVYLPQSVKNLGTKAFSSCPNLTDVIFLNGETDGLMGSYVFNTCPKLTVTCYSDSTIYNYVRNNNIPYKLLSGQSGDCSWRLDGNKLIFTGNGRIADYAVGAETPWRHIADQITELEVQDGVTIIGDNSLTGLTNISAISIADSVEFIGDNNLRDTVWYANLPDGEIYINRVFCDYKGECPATLTIRPGTVSVQGDACKGSATLEQVMLPDGMKDIGNNSFSNCPNLTSVTIPSTTVNCAVDNGCFKNCPRLTLKVVSGSLAHTYATNNSIPYTIIGAKTGDCYWTVTGNKLTFTGNGRTADYASGNDTPWHSFAQQITEVESKDGVTIIGDNALQGLTNIETISIAESIECIGNNNLKDTVWYANQPDGEIYINRVFCDYKGECPATLTVRPGTISIQGDACKDSKTLEQVMLPDGMIDIGNNSFSNCPNLTSVTILSTTVNCAVDNGCFKNDPKLTLKVVSGSLAHTYATNNSIPYTVIGAKTGGCYWYVLDNKLIICGNDRLPNYSDTNPMPWNSFANQITEIEVQDGVWGISDNAFLNIPNVSKITVPDTLTVMGENNLKNSVWYANQPDGAIYLGKVLYDYKGEIPATLTVKPGTVGIAGGVCMGSATLEQVYLADTTKNFGNNAFYNCPNLTSITSTNRETNGLIGPTVFKNCPKLTVKVVKDSSTHTFAANNSIRYSIIGDKTNECSWLVVDNKLTISGNDRLPNYTDSNPMPWKSFAQQITDIEVQDGVWLISDNAFLNMPNVSTLTVPDTLIAMGENNLKNSVWYANQPDGAIYLGKVLYDYKGEIPSTLVVEPGTVGIAGGVGMGDATLEQVNLPETVKNFGNNAFKNCPNLNTITIKNKETDGLIGPDVFGNCPNLTVYGYKGSGSETFTKNHNIPIVSVNPALLGNVNNDNKTNIRDTSSIQRYVAEFQPLTPAQFLAADVDGNGIVDINDATHLQMYLAEFDVQLC